MIDDERRTWLLGNDMGALRYVPHGHSKSLLSGPFETPGDDGVYVRVEHLPIVERDERFVRYGFDSDSDGDYDAIIEVRSSNIQEDLADFYVVLGVGRHDEGAPIDLVAALLDAGGDPAEALQALDARTAGLRKAGVLDESDVAFLAQAIDEQLMMRQSTRHDRIILKGGDGPEPESFVQVRSANSRQHAWLKGVFRELRAHSTTPISQVKRMECTSGHVIVRSPGKTPLNLRAGNEQDMPGGRTDVSVKAKRRSGIRWN